MITKTKLMQEIENKHGKPIDAIIIELYIQHDEQQQVAAALGIERTTLYKWMQRLNLEEYTRVRPAIQEPTA